MMNNIYSNFACNREEAPFYFFHIPKTAGSTLTKILEANFSDGEICPAHLWKDLLAVSENRLLTYKLFRGHFYTALNQVISCPLRAFIFIRDPLERALSHYGHVVRTPEHYLHERTMKLGSFRGYLLDHVTSETVRNFQAKTLVNNFNPLEIASKLTDFELANFRLEEIIETSVSDLTEIDLLKKAKLALSKFCCVGVTERFADSLQALNQAFDWNLKTPMDRFNVNSNRLRINQISEKDLEVLKEINSVDYQIYEYANAILDHELKKS